MPHKQNEAGRTGLPSFSSPPDRGRHSGQKTLVQRSDSDDLGDKRHATWGMSDKAIEKIKKKEIANFKEEVEAKAKMLGIPLEQVFGGVRSSTTRAKAKPKYQHPTDISKTWTGKGKRPSWVVEHEEAGGDRAELLIK